MKVLRAIVRGLLWFLATATLAFAADRVYVEGYTRKDGTVVQPHYRTAPDNSKQNNWSTKGNVNPTNGKKGTKK